MPAAAQLVALLLLPLCAELARREDGRSISLPLHRVAAPTPGFLAERHARRRRLDEAPAGAVASHVHGDLAQNGYFSTVVAIGSPAQVFELIVDTGSGVTAVPCSGCTQCGAHRRFDAHASSTVRPCKGEGCSFSIRYQEGSSYRGEYFDDNFTVGTARHCVSFAFRFGCSSVETGLFRSQGADGIMGLAPRRNTRKTVQDALVEHKMVSDAFSLCIARQEDGGRGFIAFGDALSAQMRERATWTKLIGRGSYLLELRGVQLGPRGRSLGKPQSTLLDSGTTFVYAGRRIFRPLFDALQAVELRDCGLRKGPAPRRDEMCVLPYADGEIVTEAEMAKRLDRCFEPLHFRVGNGTVEAAASSYFYAETSKTARGSLWCLGVFRNQNEQLVLGANVLQNHLVTIDRARGAVGFLPWQCGAEPHLATAASAAAVAARAPPPTCARLDAQLPRVVAPKPAKKPSPAPSEPARASGGGAHSAPLLLHAFRKSADAVRGRPPRGWRISSRAVAAAVFALVLATCLLLALLLVLRAPHDGAKYSPPGEQVERAQCSGCWRCGCSACCEELARDIDDLAEELFEDAPLVPRGPPSASRPAGEAGLADAAASATLTA